MGLLTLLGLKKRTETTKKTGKRMKTQSKTVDKRNASSPYDYNSALFEKFNDDLKKDAFPEIPNPTQAEIKDYTIKKKMELTHKGPLSESVDLDLLQENNSIPVEVDIWVDKVYNYYFDDLMPMMGLVHWCEGARKALYKYKGYTWHTISELHPTVIFD